MQSWDQKTILWILGGGALSALSFSSIMTGQPLTMILMGFSAVPLYYLSIRFGWEKGVVAMAVALVGVAILLGGGAAVFYGLAFCGPLVVLMALGRLVSKSSKKMLLAEILGAQAAYFVVLALVLMALMSNFFSQDINQIFEETAQRFPEVKAAMAQADPHLILGVLKYLPGITALWAAMMAFVSGSMAYSVALKHGKMAVTISPMETLELPFWLWTALAILGLGAVVFSESLLGMTCLNVILVLLAVFLVEGLSVLRVVLGEQKNGSFLFVVLAGFVFIFNFLLIGVVILGVLEPWVKLRQRIYGHRSNQ